MRTLHTLWPSVCRRFWRNLFRRHRHRRLCVRSPSTLVCTVCNRHCLKPTQFISVANVYYDQQMGISQKNTATFSELWRIFANIFLFTFSMCSVSSMLDGSVSQSKISSSSSMSPKNYNIFSKIVNNEWKCTLYTQRYKSRGKLVFSVDYRRS